MEVSLDKLQAKADALAAIKEEFPDLREHRTRWRTVLVSKAVNAKPEAVHTNHTCGCCTDAPLQAWFHVKRGNELIYTDPPTVYIGEKNPYHDGSDDEPYDKWDDNWQEGIRKHVGEVGVALLNQHAPSNKLDNDNG